MATNKTATLSVGIDPGLKEALHTATQQEYRSLANMVEVLIRDYCALNGVTISEQETLLDADHKPGKRGK